MFRYFHVDKDMSFAKYYHTLTFTYTFKYDKDSLFFAYCYPYSYTDLQNDLMAIERDPRRSQFIQSQTLCKTLAGVNCEVLSITDYAIKQNENETNGDGQPSQQN